MGINTNSDWDNLYEYVRSEIMGYDKTQSLSKYMILRLKGLMTGKYIENKKIKNISDYSYKILLYTFKFCSLNIRYSMQSNTFKDENHKFNYILKIIENNINDTYLKLKKCKQRKKKLKQSIHIT